jgi:hypothetical protein
MRTVDTGPLVAVVAAAALMVACADSSELDRGSSRDAMSPPLGFDDGGLAGRSSGVDANGQVPGGDAGDDAAVADADGGSDNQLTCLEPLGGGVDDAPQISSSLEEGRITVLCAGAVYSIQTPIQIGISERRLFTQGKPTGEQRALLRVDDARVTGVIRTDGTNEIVEDLEISHIQIDGGRFEWPPDEGYSERLGGVRCTGDNDCAPIITLAGVTRASVHHARLFNPRGWSHIWAGPLDRCSEVSVTDNQLGPGGGTESAFADGVSLACRDSRVIDNLITDVTDGGVVIFGGRGALVQGNTITAAARGAFIGIALTDYHQLDFTNVVVRENTLVADTGYFHIGVAAGKRLWFGSERDTEGWSSWKGTAVVVRDNALIGARYGLALPVSGVDDLTLVDNALPDGHQALVDPIHTPEGSRPASFSAVPEGALDWAIYKEGFLFRLYRELLGRHPSHAEVESFLVALLGAQGCRPDVLHGVVRAISVAEQTRQRWQGDESRFVQALYRAVARREPTASEEGTALATLGDVGPAEALEGLQNLVAALLASEEGRQTVNLACRVEAPAPTSEQIVQSAYQLVLERFADSVGLQFYREQLTQGLKTPADMLADLVFSDEFTAAHAEKSDEQYVEMLYEQLLHRSADAGGKAHYLERLGTPDVTRAEVARDYLQSSEFTAHPLHQIFRRE